jgi:hypothetical protein
MVAGLALAISTVVGLYAAWRSVEVVAASVDPDRMKKGLTESAEPRIRWVLEGWDDIFDRVRESGPDARLLFVGVASWEGYNAYQHLGTLLFPVRSRAVIYLPDGDSTRSIRRWPDDAENIWVVDTTSSMPEDVLGLRYLETQRVQSGLLHRARIRK